MSGLFVENLQSVQNATKEKKMKKNIAEILNINEQKISIKGKTSESIGFIGRQEGIAAMVSTAIQIKNTDF